MEIKLAKTLSEHWYHVGKKLYPSITTILNSYPQSAQLTQWIAEKGWHESQRIKSEAGEAGTHVHKAIEQLIKGDNLFEEDFSLEEWMKLEAFTRWFKEYNPQIMATEVSVYSKKYKYAGTVDCLCKIDDKIYVVDWKTSKSLYPHFELQVSAYAVAIEEMKSVFGVKVDRTAVLQLGARNKDKYRFVDYCKDLPWQDSFKVFLGVKKVFEHERGENNPDILELPKSLKL